MKGFGRHTAAAIGWRPAAIATQEDRDPGGPPVSETPEDVAEPFGGNKEIWT